MHAVTWADRPASPRTIGANALGEDGADDTWHDYKNNAELAVPLGRISVAPGVYRLYFPKGRHSTRKE